MYEDQPAPEHKRTDPRQATTPLLAPWATEAAVQGAARTLENEINNHFGMQRYREGAEQREADALEARVAREFPVLIAETEAFLKHEAEGWLAL